MVNILALDTAGAVLSAALSSGGGVWYAEVDAGMRHSELLMDLADTLLQSAALEAADLGGVLCMRGPGSFTGLRIGFAAARGIALSRGIPWASVPTLDCMARPHSFWPGLLLPVIDARKQSFFTALYRGPERVSDYLDAGPGEIAGLIAREITPSPGETVLLTGPDGEMLKERLRDFLDGDLFPRLRLDGAGRRGRARELLEIGLETRVLEQGGGELYEGPLYLRKSDAELNLQYKTG